MEKFSMEIIVNNIQNMDINLLCSLDDWEISTPMHNHKQVELMYVEEGSMSYDIYGVEKVVVNAGDVIFVNGMVLHETLDRSPDAKVYIMQFAPEDFLKNTVFDSNKYLSAFINDGNASYYVFRKGRSEKLCESIKNINLENTKREKGYELMILSDLYYIFAELFRRDVMQFSPNVNETNANYVQKAFAYIDKNYMNDITLGDICKSINISETHFCRIFKKVTGASFVQYLNFKRAYEAEKLLTRSDKGVTEIAYEVGFSSGSYFDRIFKKHYKISPTKYRNMNKQQQD